ncbi:ABC-type bacteriocin/lantibiotic exporter with double-glycine peptidase domain [Actinoalloteichus hoggarensis]|uniref:Uncharacterized protein n=1 Tax=Actinoalloteichus hoggarensis TaxID=1470176 RepID=A0A221W259_9PSEU|nr:hypothetical protein [Actinoalloteichus hoggarensis]ASO19783.1 hypothetical protein AHOG_10700 [Actinoalloteichus hoggarensis]MBB5919510.1 ABC-type bacteriocin/lantibiotic exporter with double-glycine peptidase domain [Actinoalloteichus hoggarensis]
MTADTATESDARSISTPSSTILPTVPCSVVWSRGHAYVLEGGPGQARWVGVDDRGRPVVLTSAELAQRGWSRTWS